MTDEEKLAGYDRVKAIIEDEIALEKHFLKKKAKWSAIAGVRADAYKRIVEAVVGAFTLPVK